MPRTELFTFTTPEKGFVLFQRTAGKAVVQLRSQAEPAPNFTGTARAVVGFWRSTMGVPLCFLASVLNLLQPKSPNL